MNLYSLHVHVAVERGPLLSSPFVGIRILHFTELKRNSKDDIKKVKKKYNEKYRNIEIQKYEIKNTKNQTIQ